MQKSVIKLFGDQRIRTIWDDEKNDYWFSVVDVVAVLTDQSDYLKARKYWNKLKGRLMNEGNQTVTNCHRLKMPAADGKMRLSDVADTEQLLRLVQSIPSKKAEPFKVWLAKVGKEFIDQAANPELAINRAVNNYRRLGYSEDWINLRLQSIQIRKILTDEWDKSGAETAKDYANLTDLMYKTWAGMNARQYKNHKGLKKKGLRDNFTNTELVLNMLAEVTATDISVVEQPPNLDASANVARRGAGAAKQARNYIKSETGKDPVTKLNAKRYLGDKTGLPRR
jgi:hypothetical protein